MDGLGLNKSFEEDRESEGDATPSAPPAGVILVVIVNFLKSEKSRSICKPKNEN